MSWRPDDIPDLTGRRAVVTGVTGGLGFHTALELARRGATLTVTARNADRATATMGRIRDSVPAAQIDVVSLDLADLSDVRRAADEVLTRWPRIDILVNNAGIMLAPDRHTTDGFELQIGTNHIGHFAWTAILWPALTAGHARVVTVSSLAHASARGIDLRSLTTEGSPRRYRRWQSYAESKLANLSFALELDRRVKATGIEVTSVAAHPGYAATNLTRTGPTIGGGSLPAMGMHQISRIVAQPAHQGAWPLLRAATDPALRGGEYLGPAGWHELRGRPRLVSASAAARDETLADELWRATETATGLTFEV